MGPTFVARLMLKKKINLSRKFNFGLCPCEAHINTAVGDLQYRLQIPFETADVLSVNVTSNEESLIG